MRVSFRSGRSPLNIVLLIYQSYQAFVPNGANVPGHPGLGHVATGGGGSRNVFGLAFAAAGHSWTPAFCEADSDGDGQTNGHELGDP